MKDLFYMLVQQCKELIQLEEYTPGEMIDIILGGVLAEDFTPEELEELVRLSVEHIAKTYWILREDNEELEIEEAFYNTNWNEPVLLDFSKAFLGDINELYDNAFGNKYELEMESGLIAAGAILSKKIQYNRNYMFFKTKAAEEDESIKHYIESFMIFSKDTDNDSRIFRLTRLFDTIGRENR